MMIYLLLSILSSTLLLVILKSFNRWKINILHGIIFNYYTAAIFSFLVAPAVVAEHIHELNNLWYVCALIGLSFILVFFIIGKTTQELGVAVASVASKMSMVIPITAGLILYNESMNVQKLTGILIAIPAVILVSIPASGKEKIGLNISSVWLPVVLFIGAGLVDTAIKYVQFKYMNDGNRQLIIMSIFGFAGLIGTFRLLYEILYLKKKLLVRSIAGGILLGITNYLSIYFLLKCLEDPSSESSTVFAFVNIGVVITSFFSGLILFKEKPERNKIIGVILSLLAIAVLSI